MKTIFTQSSVRNLMLLLIVVYFAQGVLYAQGSPISQVSLGILIIISSIYFIKTWVLKHNKTDFYFAWTLFFLVNVTGFFLTGDISNSRHYGMLKGIFIGFLPFYPFYYLSSQNKIQSKHLIIFFLFSLPFTILSFHIHRVEVLTSTGRDEMVNNIAYTFVYLMPFVFLIKKRKWMGIAMILLIFYHVIIGAKRGAFLTGSAGVLIYAYYSLRTIDTRYKIRSYLLSLAGIIIIGYYAIDMFLSNEFLVQRLESTGNEARNLIFQSLWASWYNNENSMLQLLFGFGFAASMQYSATGNLAHNDWLELLTNFGLIGVVPYLILFTIGFRYVYKSKWTIENRLLLFAVLALWLFPTFFSMGYMTASGVYRAILLGCLFGSSVYSQNPKGIKRK